MNFPSHFLFLFLSFSLCKFCLQCTVYNFSQRSLYKSMQVLRNFEIIIIGMWYIIVLQCIIYNSTLKSRAPFKSIQLGLRNSDDTLWFGPTRLPFLWTFPFEVPFWWTWPFVTPLLDSPSTLYDCLVPLSESPTIVQNGKWQKNYF